MKQLGISTALFLIFALLVQTSFSASYAFNLSTAFSPSAMLDTGGDIVGGASDDIASGASVFIFRVPRKKPHIKNSFRKTAFKRDPGAKVETRRKRVNQSATLAKNRTNQTTNTKPGSLERQAETLALAGQKLLVQKNYDQAEIKFTQARKLNPSNQTAKDGLASLFMGRGDQSFADKDYKTAAAFYERSLGFDGQNADAYASLGESYDELNIEDKAALAYENALRLNPALDSLVPTLGLMFYEAANYPKAEKYLGQALITSPGNTDLQNTYGLALMKQDKNNEAITAFQNAVQLLPAFADAHNNLGEVYAKLGRNQEAEAEYKEAIRVNPNLSETYYNLGVASYNREQYPEAATYYEKAIELKPDFVEARSNLADTYRQMEKFDSAVATYKTIVPYTPNDPELYSKYGYCEGRNKNWEESAQLLEKATELDGGANAADDNTNTAWAYNNAGRSARKEKDDAKAAQSFTKGKEVGQKAAEKDPNSATAKFNLGDSLTGLGETEAAVATLRAALGLRPDWAEAHNNLGLALNLAGDLAGASSEFRNATGINNNFIGAFANLAIVEYKRGNKKEGQKAAGRVKELNPTFATQLESYVATYVLNKVQQKVKDKVRGKLPF
ncbi:MAG: tetratricopeptide repeat protein [Pyrinomonadaceae bacterium]